MAPKALLTGIELSPLELKGVVDLAEKAGDDDLLMQLADDVRLFVDRASLPILRGTTVDFVREGLNSVLRFGNPNAQDHCGCGESFSIGEARA